MDLARDDRICAYNDASHGGVHPHHPLDGPAGRRVDVPSRLAAVLIARAYAARHEAFVERAFLEEVRAWRSMSRSG